MVVVALTLLAACDIAADNDPDAGSTTAVTTAGPTQTAPPRERFHRGPGQSYRFENSPRGLRHARRNGYDWIDIDSIHCRDDEDGRPVPLATHWPRIDHEGFDPLGQYPPKTRWTDLTLRQVRALQTTDDPPYRVLTMIEMLEAASRIGVGGIEWEIKDGPGFTQASTYRPVLRAAARLGISIEVKTIFHPEQPGLALARLRAASRAGATTMLLNLDDEPVPLTAAEQEYVDFVRGHGGWQPA